MSDEPGGVDRLPDPADPGGNADRTPSRQRQERTAEQVASDLGIDRQGVGTVDRLRGLDVFLRSSGAQQFGGDIREEFAADAEFVRPEDVDPNIDRDAITAAPAVATGRRDDVGARAREQAAADAPFIEPGDLDAAVGAAGVREVETDPERRDDIAARARERTAAADAAVKPGDVAVDVTESGIADLGLSETGAAAAQARQSAADNTEFVQPDDVAVETADGEIAGLGLTAEGQRERAARRLETTTALSEIDPSADVTRTDSGLGLDSNARQRAAARGFEDDLAEIEQGALSPDDIRETGDGGLALDQETVRGIAASRIDEQVPDTSIAPGDVSLSAAEDGSFEASFVDSTSSSNGGTSQ